MAREENPMSEALPADPPEPDQAPKGTPLPERVLRYDPPPPAPEGGSPLVAALARARARFAPIKKSKTAHVTSTKGNYDYNYADLSDVIEATTGALSEQGLVEKQTLEWRDLGEGLRWWCATTLKHVSGESAESLYLLPDPLTLRPQEVGSAITYARRYSYCAIVGVQAEEDEDGRQAEDAADAGAKPKRTTSGGLPMGGRKPPAAAPAPAPTDASGNPDDQAGRGGAPPPRRAPPSRGGGAAPPRGPASDAKISDQQRRMLFAKAQARAKALGFDERDAAHTVLHDLLGDFGVESTSDLPASKMDTMLRAIDGYDPELRGGDGASDAG
jgi:hypothetical protein